MEGIKTLTGEIVKRVKDFREAQQQVELPEMELTALPAMPTA